MLPKPAKLRELFEAPQPQPGQTALLASPPSITLGTLALSLGCSVDQLLPLAEAGYLRVLSENGLASSPAAGQPNLTSQTYVETISEPALLWLRTWLQPAQAKPLLSAADLADLLGLTPREVPMLAAQYNVPATFDPAFGGLVFSVWAARQLVMKVTCGRNGIAGERWDRQALLWMLLEGNPDTVLRPVPLTYSEALDREIERVAGLPEPARGIRASALLQQFEEARRVFEAGRAGRAGRGRKASKQAGQAGQPTNQPIAQTSSEQPQPGPGVPADEPASELFSPRFEQLKRALGSSSRTRL